MPPKLPRHLLTGRVFWRNGNPASKIKLCFIPTEMKRWTGKLVITDSAGNFEVELFTGKTYIVKVWQNKNTLYELFQRKFPPSSEFFKIDEKTRNLDIRLNVENRTQ